MAMVQLDLGNVRGPQGLQGIQGEQGIQGVPGERGPQGDPGYTPPKATKTDAETGTDDSKYMTPLRVKELLDSLELTPVGDVAFRPYLAKKWVKANGATVNRADYPRLVKFATDNNLWTDSPSTEPWKYGRGNGSTTMVLPDYRNRFIQGGDTPSAKQAGLPNIEGTLYPDGQAHVLGKYAAPDLQKGCFKGRNNTSAVYNSGRSEVSGAIEIAFSASYSNTIYGSSNTVQPPAIVMLPQIRY